MNCLNMRDKLGPYVDDELSAIDAQRIRAHLDECNQCREEASVLRELAAAITQEATPEVPPTLWGTIEQRLARETRKSTPPQVPARWIPMMRVAALIALAVGLGSLVVFVRPGENAAQAASIDFSVLLDELPLDPQKAFSRFLTLYNGVEIAPAKAESFAPDLDFEVPAVLPGGFQRLNVYGLRFGTSPGVAARYERSGEFLVAIFHPTVHPEQFGTHQDYPCVVGEHRGHMVSVGEWRLVHVTDPVTCHCVLSQLDETELPPVLKAVAPESKPSAKASQHYNTSGSP